MTDNVCLVFDPSSSSCAKSFSFFSFSDWNSDISGIYKYSYLGLAPIGSLNGPSFVQSLNSTGSMLNATVSFQLGDWSDKNDFYGDNNVTFGGNVESAFAGFLKFNYILKES